MKTKNLMGVDAPEPQAADTSTQLRDAAAQAAAATATLDARVAADKVQSAAPAPAPAPAPTNVSPFPSPKPPAPTPAPLPGGRVVSRDEAPAEVNPTLALILSWKRPFESKAEIDFMGWLRKYLDTLLPGDGIRIAAKGNLVATVKRPNGTVPSTMFSCHTDTVHSEAKSPRQKIVYDSNFGHIFLDKADPDAGSCLGADDGAGIWLMLQMIHHKVPGVYVFHRGEERGGLGAYEMLREERQFLAGFDVAVAFDRPNDYEVITHQGGMRCASDKFGLALAKALNDAGGGKLAYELSGRGVFTDTKVYRSVIAECVNIGVGYVNQHSRDEELDYVHLLALRDACIKLNWEALPVDRDPHAAEEAVNYGGWTGRGHGRYGQADLLDDDSAAYGAYWNAKSGKKKRKHGGGISSYPPAPAPTPAPAPKPATVEPSLNPEDEFRDCDVASVAAWMETDPEAAAKHVLNMAAEMAGLRATLHFLKGTIQ